ncbi:unnamed protein product [Vitrella brassicaformis CCMP3155]|uniref:Uncharacterized protein n=3 Tax=Vitrella brassicaformis TaxID=1169539 RepID=A0A0G4GJG0_VITBC|nr:unnamed protein product [Vitrella brassicaformis CCMP3155]|eukprot:CEM30086.1 unnamed protein product [Vitrella brassicaformis CCMP3155]
MEPQQAPSPAVSYPSPPLAPSPPPLPSHPRPTLAPKGDVTAPQPQPQPQPPLSSPPPLLSSAAGVAGQPAVQPPPPVLPPGGLEALGARLAGYPFFDRMRAKERLQECELPVRVVPPPPPPPVPPPLDLREHVLGVHLMDTDPRNASSSLSYAPPFHLPNLPITGAPFYRLHFIDRTTPNGRYMVKSEASKIAVYDRPLSSFSASGVQKQMLTPHILPYTSAPQRPPRASLVLMEPLAYLMQRQCLLLVEMLAPCKHGYQMDKKASGGASVVRLAWGFLSLPHLHAALQADAELRGQRRAQGGTLVRGDRGGEKDDGKPALRTLRRKLRLTLYRYAYTPPSENAPHLISHPAALSDTSSPGALAGPAAPVAYFEYVWPRKKPAPFTLTLTVDLIPTQLAMEALDITSDTMRYVMESREEPRKLPLPTARAVREGREERAGVEELIPMDEARREAGTLCVVPERLAYELPTAESGCSRLAFHPQGEFLAAAVARRNRFDLRVFRVRDGVLTAVLKGHQALVYDLIWCPLPSSAAPSMREVQPPPDEPMIPPGQFDATTGRSGRSEGATVGLLKNFLRSFRGQPPESYRHGAQQPQAASDDVSPPALSKNAAMLISAGGDGTVNVFEWPPPSTSSLLDTAATSAMVEPDVVLYHPSYVYSAHAIATPPEGRRHVTFPTLTVAVGGYDFGIKLWRVWKSSAADQPQQPSLFTSPAPAPPTTRPLISSPVSPPPPPDSPYHFTPNGQHPHGRMQQERWHCELLLSVPLPDIGSAWDERDMGAGRTRVRPPTPTRGGRDEGNGGIPQVLCVRFAPTRPHHLYASLSNGTLCMWALHFYQGEPLQLTLIRSFLHLDLVGTPLHHFQLAPTPPPQMSSSAPLSPTPRSPPAAASLDQCVLLNTKDNLVRMARLHHASLHIDQILAGSQCTTHPIRSVLSPDGRLVASGCESGRLVLWEVASGQMKSDQPRVRAPAPVMAVAWSPTHHILACAAYGRAAGDAPILVFYGVTPREGEQPVATAGVRLSVSPRMMMARPHVPPIGLPLAPLQGEETLTDWATRWIEGTQGGRLVDRPTKQRMKAQILEDLIDTRLSRPPPPAMLSVSRAPPTPLPPPAIPVRRPASANLAREREPPRFGGGDDEQQEFESTLRHLEEHVVGEGGFGGGVREVRPAPAQRAAVTEDQVMDFDDD